MLGAIKIKTLGISSYFLFSKITRDCLIFRLATESCSLRLRCSLRILFSHKFSLTPPFNLSDLQNFSDNPSLIYYHSLFHLQPHVLPFLRLTISSYKISQNKFASIKLFTISGECYMFGNTLNRRINL